MNKRIALVTNALDFVGPPAVKALLEDGYSVVAQDSAFQDGIKQEDYEANHTGTIIKFAGGWPAAPKRPI